jgi:hypothetical protein
MLDLDDPQSIPSLVTLDEIADLLRVDVHVIETEIAASRLAAVVVAGYQRVHRHQLLAYLDQLEAVPA